MKDTKIILNSSEKDQEETLQKRRYERPRLGTVTLFADRVLAGCEAPSDSCSIISPVANDP